MHYFGGMDAVGFIQRTADLMTDFLNREFASDSKLPKTIFSADLKSLAETREPKRGLFGGLFADPGMVHAALFPYGVARVDFERRDEFRSSNVMLDNGKRGVASVRGSDAYRIQFAVVGPQAQSSQGLALCSGLIATFFDHRVLQVESQDGDEQLLLQELHVQHDDHVMDALKEAGFLNRPIYYFSTVVRIETGRVIRKSTLVEKRNISVQSGADPGLRPNSTPVHLP
jgi:hypothetical protein